MKTVATPPTMLAPAMHPPPPAPNRTPEALNLIGRELRVVLPLCVAVAGFLSIMFRDPFWSTLVYSLCIGVSIQLLIEGGRHGMSAWRRRGGNHSPAQAASLRNNWPGWPFMAPWVVFSAAGGYVLGSLLADALTGSQRQHVLFSANPRALTLVLLVSVAVSAAATYFFYARGRMATLAANTEAARRAAAESQLLLLQSQLEPHMLFNTLANLRALIGVAPAQAQTMLDHLIAYLRATLQATRSPTHTLAAEFDRVADYLALMAVRMGPRLQVTFDLPAPLRELPVPAMLLQALVENSLKHGLEPKLDGGRIAVSAQRDGHTLVLRVRDTGLGLGPAAGPGQGFGTAQVRERLAALFGSTASFNLHTVDDAQGGTLAEIQLPIALP